MHIELFQKAFETTVKDVTDAVIEPRGSENYLITDTVAPRNLLNPSAPVKVVKGYFAYNMNRVY
jgi:hypothetical protein